MTRKLKKPVEELRKDLLADPHTQSIAKTVGLSTEEYVEKVLYFATHPDEQPTFNVLPEAEVKAQGGANVGEVKAWLEKVDRGEIQVGPKGYTDGFDDAKPAKPGAKKA